MLNEQDDIWDVITSGLDRPLDIHEKTRLEEWLQASPANRRSYEWFSGIKFHGFSTIQVRQQDEVFQEVMLKIRKSEKKKILKKYLYAAAAFIVILLSTATLFYQYGKTNVHAQRVEISTPKGIRTTVSLSDGSTIVLNSNSKLIYPTLFSGKNREVSFEGEGYFQVSKDKNHPFIVKSGEQVIKVLGTRFNLKSYPEDLVVETTLEEGSVVVCSNRKKVPVFLSPGQQAVLDKRSQDIKVLPVEPYKINSWQIDKFYFKSRTFEDIAHVLERKFDVRIEILSTKLKRTVFTGDFVRGENLDQILKIIKRNTNIIYQKTGQTIIISD